MSPWKMTVPDTVALLATVKVIVVLAILLTSAFTPIPVPVTCWPTAIPVVLATTIVLSPDVPVAVVELFGNIPRL